MRKTVVHISGHWVDVSVLKHFNHAFLAAMVENVPRHFAKYGASLPVSLQRRCQIRMFSADIVRFWLNFSCLAIVCMAGY